MPSLDTLNLDYRDKGLQVLLINLKEEPSQVASFIEGRGYSFKVLLDRDGAVAQKYHVLGIPVSYLIDGDGRVVSRFSGFVDWGSRNIRSTVDGLVKEQPGKSLILLEDD